MVQRTVLALTLAALLAPAAHAEIRRDRVHVADSKKNKFYVKDGMIVGGDKAIEQVVVTDIRRSKNPEFERFVIDLEGNLNGDPAAVKRPPYYQIAVTPDEKRLVFSIWGKPRLAFDSRRVVAALKKSPAIQSVQLLPRLEEDSWSFVFELKAGYPVEAFELSNPTRVIMDIRTARK